MSQKIKEAEQAKKIQIRKALKEKPLIRVLRKGKKIDGILLFGSNKGKRISDLLRDFNTSPYVLNYLLQSKDLPKSFQNKVQEIVIHFTAEEGGSSFPAGATVFEKRSILTADDDIPW
jgi:hypothetical protein